jgi:hypothetical protein
MQPQHLSTNEKARSINMSKAYFGTIAEIGAGQEISRWFFKVGGASGTVAKAISAYDMAFSDAIYGPEPTGRYVVESRVQKMINYEYDLLLNRSKSEIQGKRSLFALANTVAAKSPKYKGDCHGWLGLKYQLKPGGEAHEIIVHIRMLDSTNLQQQETLGLLGVNLLHAALNHSHDVRKLVSSLADGDLKESIEINTLRFKGPAFKDLDIYAANLLPLEMGLTPAVLIRADGVVSHLAEELYLKQVLIHRAEFNPMTSSDMDMLLSARDHYCNSKTEGECAPFLLSELFPETLNAQTTPQWLHRIRMLLLAKQNILISQFKDTFQLMDYLEKFTKDHIHFVYPSKKLIDIFEKNHFSSFEALARIFKDQTRMYFYPTPSHLVDGQYIKDSKQPYFTLNNYAPSAKNKHLFAHLMSDGYLEDIKDHHCDPSLLISDHDLQQMIKGQKKDWEKFVPPVIANYIKSNSLFI